MIISHSHKFIFIHINKCAGTSIGNSLLPYLGKNDINIGYGNQNNKYSFSKNILKKIFIIPALPIYFKRILTRDHNAKIANIVNEIYYHAYVQKKSLKKHSPAIAVRNYVGEQVWDTYFKFTFTRNPWDRIVSTYFWYKKGWRIGEEWPDKIRELSFKDYVKSKYLCEPPSTSFIYDEDENIIIDYAGKQENLQKDYNFILKKVGLPLIEIPMLNTSIRGKSYRVYYDNETQSIIREMYKKDIVEFNYEF